MDFAMSPSTPSQCTALLTQFVAGKLSPSDFERQFLDSFKAVERFAEPEYDALQPVFSACDAFNPDPKDLGPQDIGEAELRRVAELALRRLQRYGAVSSFDA